MIKIWAKLIADNKILRDIIYKKDALFTPSNFLDYLIDICYELDCPTPVILNCHKKNFDSFNIVKFRQPDFVETIDFDTLMLENAVE